MKSKNLAIGGISVALSIFILYITLLIPINTLAILVLASSIIPIVIIKSNIKTAITVYISVSLLSFFFLPINYFILYLLLFGVYGIIKHFIEQLNNMAFEVVIKLIVFNVILTIGYFSMKAFVPSLNIRISLWILVIAAQFAFLIYDYALTAIITFYFQRLDKK